MNTDKEPQMTQINADVLEIVVGHHAAADA
jgi:hypothetical protein